MRKYAILVMLVAFIVAFTSSCGLIVKDAEVDAQTVIIEVAGQSIVKADVQQAIVNLLDYQEYLYSYYGMSYDRTDADNIASAQENAINALIEDIVTKQKIQEYGLDQFTDEELQAIGDTVNTTYENNLAAVKTYYFADTELTGDELDTAVEAKMLEVGYSSLDSLLENEKESISQDKLKNMIVENVTVSEDEVETAYNNSVAAAISDYTNNPTQYASDVNSGAILYVTPPGYRYVKNLLIKISDEDATQLSTLRSSLSDAQASLDATQEALNTLDDDATEKDKEEVIAAREQNRTELKAQLETFTEEVADLTTQLETLTASAYDAIQPTMDEVEAKIAAGDDFDALIEEYGEDTGMQSEPTKSTGYLICDGLTTYVDVFVEESMALEKVGDISDPFRSSYGVHIVQYANDLEDGQVPLADIHDQVQAELLTNKQDSLYDETVNQWITDANARIYENRLND